MAHEDQVLEGSLSFVTTIVKECSQFFFNLHKFCENYADKLSKENPHIRASPKKIKKAHFKKTTAARCSPYINFFKSEVKNLAHTQYDGRKLSKMIAEKWKKMSLEERKAYKESSWNPNLNAHDEDNIAKSPQGSFQFDIPSVDGSPNKICNFETNHEILSSGNEVRRAKTKKHRREATLIKNSFSDDDEMLV